MAKKILVVDDEADIRQTIKFILKKEGYEVTEAEDGQVCLNLLKNQKFDLIILDVMMPKMSGWDVLTEIFRIKKKEYKNKIIFLSVVEISKEREKILLQEGVVDYITKPFDVKNLSERINKILK